MRTELLKRTFEAASHPEGSWERKRLNEKSETSEYYTPKKWTAILHYPDTAIYTNYKHSRVFTTKKEAEAWLHSEITSAFDRAMEKSDMPQTNNRL